MLTNPAFGATLAQAGPLPEGDLPTRTRETVDSAARKQAEVLKRCETLIQRVDALNAARERLGQERVTPATVRPGQDPAIPVKGRAGQERVPPTTARPGQDPDTSAIHTPDLEMGVGLSVSETSAIDEHTHPETLARIRQQAQEEAERARTELNKLRLESLGLHIQELRQRVFQAQGRLRVPMLHWYKFHEAFWAWGKFVWETRTLTREKYGVSVRDEIQALIVEVKKNMPKQGREPWDAKLAELDAMLDAFVRFLSMRPIEQAKEDAQDAHV